MNASEMYINNIKPGLALPWWFTHEIPGINADFNERVVSLPQNAQWRSTQIDGIDLRVLEYIPGPRPRLTAQVRLQPDSSPARLGDNPDLEILIQRGELETEMGFFPAGLYLRLPLTDEQHLQELTVHCTPPLLPKHTTSQDESALLYLAAGQMLTSDTEQRCLDTNDPSRWLPGPVDGTEVLPLHGHGSGNVMLIRWNRAVAFKPRLDPMGEEVLVLSGSLYDGHGHYPAGSWIRNPIAAWQSWGAIEGTMVYYKNGHFTVSPAPS